MKDQSKSIALISKYQDYFQDSNGKPTLQWGIECGDGWLPLVEIICEMVKYTEDNIKSWNKYYQGDEPKKEELDFKFVTIKQKFGKLRIYVNNCTPEIYGAIHAMEHMSWSICEFCGSNNDVIHTKGWINTICKKCNEKRI